MQKHFHCHKVEDQLWVSSSSVDPSEGHAAGMSFLLKAFIFLMFCGPLIYHTSIFWPMWHQLLNEITSNNLLYKRQKSLLVVQPIISWKATKLYILCTTQFTKTANKSFFFFEWFGFEELALAGVDLVLLIHRRSPWFQLLHTCLRVPSSLFTTVPGLNQQICSLKQKNYVWCNNIILVVSHLQRGESLQSSVEVV